MAGPGAQGQGRLGGLLASGCPRWGRETKTAGDPTPCRPHVPVEVLCVGRACNSVRMFKGCSRHGCLSRATVHPQGPAAGCSALHGCRCPPVPPCFQAVVQQAWRQRRPEEETPGGGDKRGQIGPHPGVRPPAESRAGDRGRATPAPSCLRSPGWRKGHTHTHWLLRERLV